MDRFFVDSDVCIKVAQNDKETMMSAYFKRYDLRYDAKYDRIDEGCAIAFQKFLNDADVRLYVSDYLRRDAILISKSAKKYDISIFLLSDGQKLLLKNDKKTICVTEKNGVNYTLPQPYMADSAGQTNLHIRYNMKIDRGTLLRLDVDEKWINSSDRMFPIIIYL